MDKEIKNEKIHIGKTLKNIRISLGMTQEQVAEALGLAPRYISDIKRDKTKGSIDTLIKLCNVYNVTPSYILKDYINTYDSDLDDTFVGYYNLSDYEKNIIRNLIHFMNQNKLKNT